MCPSSAAGDSTDCDVNVFDAIKADCYHRKSPDHIIVGANTDVIFATAFPSDRPLPCSDGWWGPHEYAVVPQLLDKSSPYLAWVPSLEEYAHSEFQRNTGLDPTLVRLHLDDYPVLPVVGDPSSPSSNASVNRLASHRIPGLPTKPQVRQLSKSRLHQLFRTSSSMRTIIKTKATELMAQASAAFSAVRADGALDAIRIPEQALFRLEQASLWNRLHNSEAGHRLVLAGLKRAVMELHSFLLWRNYVQDRFHQTYRRRGVYVNSMIDFDHLRTLGVPVYLHIQAPASMSPPRIPHVDLTPIPIQSTRLFPEGYVGGHHCSIFFYPPIVHDFQYFELAARGYHSRIDEYHANRDMNKIFDNMRKDSRVFAEGIYFPVVKGSPNHVMQQARQEYNRIQPFAPVPPIRAWYLAWQQMEYPAALSPQSRPAKIHTAFPPPLFFFNAATPQKQRSYFYIWCCIRRDWTLRWAHGNASERDQMLLTHARWREILSGEIFKKNSTPTHPYDLKYFWLSDPHIIFEKGKDSQDLTPLCRGLQPLLPEMFEDAHPAAFAIKRFLCYDVAISHVKHQFEQADDAFLESKGLDPDSHAVLFRKNRRESLFRTSVEFIHEAPAWESSELIVRAAWYEELRYFIKDWQVDGLQKDMRLLQEPEFSLEVQILLIVYFEGIARFLNTVPTMLWTFPGTRDVIFCS